MNVPEQKGDYLPDGWRIENQHTIVRLFDPNGACVIEQPIGLPWMYGDPEYYKRSDISMRQIARWCKDRSEHQPIESDPVALRNEIRRLRGVLTSIGESHGRCGVCKKQCGTSTDCDCERSFWEPLDYHEIANNALKTP